MLTSDPVILAFFEEELLKKRPEKRPITGKSLSEAPIFASTNPQYDDRLFNT
jgi:hypothetical protein